MLLHTRVSVFRNFNYFIIIFVLLLSRPILGVQKQTDEIFERIPCPPVWQGIYKCDLQDLSHATAFGMNLTCATNQVCNFAYIEPCQP